MLPSPLHPLFVHLPLALAALLPFLCLATTLAVARFGRPGSLWHLVAGAQVLLAVSGFAAMKAGEVDEDRAGRFVDKALIHEHEERAEAFVWTAGGVALLALGASFVRRPSHRRALVVTATLGTFVVAFLAVRTGAAGGALVYEHGAARAFAPENSKGD